MDFFSLVLRKNIIKINPVGFLVGNVNAGWEHVLNDKSSFEIGARYSSVKGTIGSDDDVKFTGFGAYAMYRFYLSNSKSAPRGIYVAPNVGFNKTSSSDDFDSDASIFNIGGLFGHQWAWGGESGFVLDIGIGAAYYNSSFSGDDQVDDFGLDGIGPQLRLALGYSF